MKKKADSGLKAPKWAYRADWILERERFKMVRGAIFSETEPDVVTCVLTRGHVRDVEGKKPFSFYAFDDLLFVADDLSPEVVSIGCSSFKRESLRKFILRLRERARR